MNPKRLKWENGLKIDSQVLTLSDALTAEAFERANLLPFNLSNGIISFELDKKSLITGLVLIKKLQIYIENKKFISFDNSYPLSLQVQKTDEIAPIIPIYINLNDRTVEYNNKKCVGEVLSLSTEYDYTSAYSIIISSFRMNNSSLEMIENDFVIFTMNHYLMDEIFLKFHQMVSKVENYNKYIASSLHHSIYIYLNYLLLKFKRELSFAELNKESVSPLEMFNHAHNILSFLYSCNMQNKDIPYTTLRFDMGRSYDSLNQVINQIEKFCTQPVLKNFVQFHKVGQKYICENFPQEFFSAKKHYFIIKNKPDIKLTNKLTKEIKITSISRYTNNVVLSLPGIKLKEVDNQMHQDLYISLGRDDLMFKIESSSEWDFILVDKSATFISQDIYENYDFFIAFI
jgi:predicted component of type VI protein secretion system